MNCKTINSEYMKNLKYIFILIAICSTQLSNAQQDYNFTLYNFNMNVINPAYAGAKDISEITLGYRSQWAGINDAPNTQMLTYSAPFKNNLGLGVSIVRDQVFVLQETDVTVDVSYKLKLSETHLLYFGLKAGGSFVDIDLNKAGAPGNDPLFSENQTFFNTQIGAGLYLKHAKYYVSVSTPNFLNGERFVKQGNAPSAAVDHLHMYFGTGYHINVSDNFMITPAVMHRSTDGAPSSTDVSTTFSTSKIDAGLNYRIDEMYSVFMMFSIYDSLKLGAAYDFTSSKLNTVNDNGSMEFMIKYLF